MPRLKRIKQCSEPSRWPMGLPEGSVITGAPKLILFDTIPGRLFHDRNKPWYCQCKSCTKNI